MNKKIMFIFGIICIIFFLIFYYIFCIYGNNNIRNQNELLKDIFKKLERYEANIDVEVISNKNENKYNMFQIVDGENSKLVVNTPENVKGLEIEFDNPININGLDIEEANKYLESEVLTILRK